MITKAREQTSHSPKRSANAQVDLPLRQFAQDFFTFFGASVKRLNRRKQGPIHVVLPPDLVEHFGKEEMTLVFHGEDLNQEEWCHADLVAIGSRTFEKICTYLHGRGALVVQQLPARFGSGDELLQAIKPVNASVIKLNMQEQMHDLFLFDWRISYRADDKREEIYTVALDDSGAHVALEDQLASETPNPLNGLSIDTLLEDAEPLPMEKNADGQPIPPRLPPMTQLGRLAETARKYAIYHADVRCVDHEAEIQTRLYKSLNRLHTYYSQQIEEVYDAHDPNGEKRQALESDLQRKLAEEVENHRLRVDVRLLSYAILRLPVAVADLTLHDGQREIPIRVRRNRYTGALRRPQCHACGEETAQIAIDRNGHVTCDDCLHQCQHCQEILCEACGVETCPVCAKENCDTCSTYCWACGGRACAEHASRCPICQDAVCHACQAECAHCGERQCRSHLRADSVLQIDGVPALVCAECAVRCSHCQQYSTQIDTCEASGQRFCTNCLETCTTCGKRVGPGFSYTSEEDGRPYCQDCITVCPTCQRAASALLHCAACDASCCAGCSETCVECGERYCANHVQVDATCGHALCHEHAAECGVGHEIVCPHCNETCAICERHFCSEHAAACALCRCTYCAECIRTSLGLCDTCATLEKEGQSIYLPDDPVAEHPEVAPLVHEYRWVRTGNTRYTIYLGKGPFNTGALILVQNDLPADEDPVLVARKLASIDQYWRQY